MNVRVSRPTVLAEMPVRSHFAIEASAGTGKTYLIEHRVVDLIVRAEVPIEQILVVTFTEKATSELKQRIRALLSKVADNSEHDCEPDQPHWLIDDSARERLRLAVMGFDRVSISTIHGFCHRLVGEQAFAGGKQLRQQQIADITAFESAFRAEIRERFASDSELEPYLRAWLESGKSTTELGKLLYGCVRERAEIEPRLDERALVAAADRAVELTAAAAPGAEDRFKKAGVHHSRARSIANGLAVVTRAIAAADRNPAQLVASLDPVKLDELRDRIEATGIDAALADAIAELDRCCPPLPAAAAARFVPPIVARLAAEKHEHGLFDFDDMLSQLWTTLDGPGGDDLAAELREDYPFALIDEFQDTDELQWQIFKRIYLGGDGAYLSIIGDPKQAIYGFRGADVYTYLRAREELCAAGGRIVRLQDNYRSSPELVAAYNQIFDDLFTEGIDYQPVNARADVGLRDDAGQPAAPFVVLDIESDSKLSAGDLKRQALAALIGELEALLRERPLILDEGGDSRRVGPGDCFVLTRGTADAHEVADALRARSIPCALFQQEGLLTSTEAAEVRDLLAAIASPGDRSARLKAWRTRFFAVELGELGELGALEDQHPLVARLYDWNELADRLDYERLFSSIADDSGVIERELLMAPSERALTNVLHLFELLLTDVVASRCDIHELLVRFERWIADAELVSSQDRNLQRLESDKEAVQIMTVHKSKGLEAPVVFMYGGFGSAPHGKIHVYHQDGRRRVHVGRIEGSAKERAQAEAAAEDQRLLYVAITRAAGRVIVPHVDPDVGKVSGYYGALNRRLGAVLGQPGFERRSARSTGDARQAGSSEDDIAAAMPALASVAGPPTHLPAHRRGFTVTSYTRLKYASERAFDDRGTAHDHSVELETDQLPGGAESGILV
ncbi:MAG: UvrD-helicase domain-containing protein, partial [Deltaproteobacteria bacterium]|nr:UvrD-helicase domain-containing protein [Deltaproteobacteria bacterium]